MNTKLRLASALVMLSMLLGVKNGYLALWIREDPQPCYTFPVPLSALPPADQILLRRGIPVENVQVLQQLLEDYL